MPDLSRKVFSRRFRLSGGACKVDLPRARRGAAVRVEFEVRTLRNKGLEQARRLSGGDGVFSAADTSEDHHSIVTTRYPLLLVSARPHRYPEGQRAPLYKQPSLTRSAEDSFW
jgi:hypothetical protein